jgi:hypothetical protein
MIFKNMLIVIKWIYILYSFLTKKIYSLIKEENINFKINKFIEDLCNSDTKAFKTFFNKYWRTATISVHECLQCLKEIRLNFGKTKRTEKANNGLNLICKRSRIQESLLMSVALEKLEHYFPTDKFF